jgi:phospholipase C
MHINPDLRTPGCASNLLVAAMSGEVLHYLESRVPWSEVSVRNQLLRVLSVGASFSLITACTGSGGMSPTPSVAQEDPVGAGAQPFAVQHAAANVTTLPKYVVVMIQENRTVDNLFQTQPGVNTQSYGYDSHGTRINLVRTGLGVSFDCSHAHSAFDNDVLEGFDTEPCGKGVPPTGGSFTYVNPSDITEYTTLGSDFAFADNVLQGNEGPSFPAHLYLIAATTKLAPGSDFNISENDSYSSGSGCEPQMTKTISTINMTKTWPEDDDKATAFPCITVPTIFNELDSAHIGWRFYTPNLKTIWNAPYAVKSLYDNDKSHVVVPQSNILTDIMHGELQPVSYVIPGAGETDHPGNVNDTKGPAWVGSVFNALTTSKKYGKDFAMIVVWDDWGGFFDHVPATHETKLPIFPENHAQDPYEYGYRVPLIAIGPFARTHYVNHTRRNFTSIVHFIENVYGLPSLGELDAQTDDLFPLFDFTSPPKTHAPIPTGDVTIQSLLLEKQDPNFVVDSQ